MTDPLLFLDVDGVLNSATWDSARPGLPMPDNAIDDAAVRRVNRIVAESGCSIVVSSSWRLMWSLEELAALFERRGAVGWRLIGATPDGAEREHGPLWLPCQRGTEIAMWREQNGHVGPFAVLDDSGDMDDVADNYVATNYRDGIQDRHVDEALVLLGGVA